MFKNLSLFIAYALIMTSCLKKTEVAKCTGTAPATVASDAEVNDLQTYIYAHGLAGSVTRHPYGFFYHIADSGTGISPGLCSNVLVTYRGKLEDGTQFDSSLTGTTFILDNLIDGWKLGLPLLKKGGKINLYLPPSLGYGSRELPGVPSNSKLIFELQLFDVVN